MTKQQDTAPVSGSEDARSGGERADADRERVAEQAEQKLRQNGFRKDGAASDDRMSEDLETRSHELARAYLQLGGHRRAVMDDNKTDTRKWEPDEPEAEAFWQMHIAPLSEAERKQVEQHLPSVNED